MNDSDIDLMDTPQLKAEIIKLRNAIRRHRDSSGHDLCWYHPELWGLLPDNISPSPQVPSTCEFLENCAKYRQSLEQHD